MKQYFIIDGQEQKGPYSIEELKALSIKRDTYVWFDGANGWAQAQTLDPLKELFKTPPPFSAAEVKTPPPPPPFSRNEPVSSEPEPFFESPNKKIPFVPIGIGAIVVLTLTFLYINSRRETALVQSQVTQMQVDQSQKETERQQKEEERKRALEELTLKNRNYRNNWANYFVVDRSSYNLGLLGGIHDLSLNFQNTTEYMADEMVATVTYIKANGVVWDRVDVVATNVPAFGAKTIGVPDMERGTSVRVEMKRVASKKLHFYVGDNYHSGNPEDPYFAR